MLDDARVRPLIVMKIRLRQVRQREFRPRGAASTTSPVEDLDVALDAYFDRVAGHLSAWKASYEWPSGVRLGDALKERQRLAGLLHADRRANGSLGAQSVSEVMRWGFGDASVPPDSTMRRASTESLAALERDDLPSACQPLLRLPGWGISRVTKVLALVDQRSLGIYDSRVADGLSDFEVDGSLLVPVPPGRMVRGTRSGPAGWAGAYELFIRVIRGIRNRARHEPLTRSEIRTASDVEIAFFARSRSR